MKEESTLSILFPLQDEVTYALLPDAAWHDLGLDALTEKIAQQPQEVPLLRRVMTSMTADPRVSAWRAEVFEDLLNHPEIRDRLMKLLEKVKTFYDYGVVKRHDENDTGVWDLLHRLEEYHDYIVAVEEIRECLSGKDITSRGLCALRDTVDRIYRSNGFEALKKDVEAMRTSASEVRSLTIGMNLNERFEAVSIGLITVNSKPFTHSGLLKHFITAVSPRNDIYPEADWNGSYSAYPASMTDAIGQGADRLVRTAAVMRNPLLGLSMAAVPDSDGGSMVPRQMDSAASMLLSRLTKKLKATLAQYVNISVKEISGLIPELVFYTRWAEYISAMRKKGWRFCRPEIFAEASETARMEAEGFYNLKLIGAEAPENVVPNDLAFDAQRRIYVLTGANRGGKTTVTQAVGQLFLLAQCGISVPADSFRFDPADRVFTHFPADEDKTLDLGRLGEECRRFRELFAESSGRSLILLNETFSTTSFEEGYYIAVDAVKAILQKDARAVYNTHMHKLAQELDEAVNSDDKAGKAVSLVSETREGRHTFRVRIAPPEGKSFAREIAVKYGVTFEALTGNPGLEREEKSGYNG